MSLQSESTEIIDAAPTISERFGHMVLRRIIATMRMGKLVVVTPAGERFENQAEAPGPEAVLVLRRWRALRRLFTGGDLAFAEAYIDGDWSSPDLTALIALASRNIGHVETLIAGRPLVRNFNRLRHLLNANTRSGSRRNIHFHYDLGNDFYRLWLDRSMTYSSALYADGKHTLEDAQAAKLARIIDLLDLARGTRVLEIGCGWGTLAARMTQRGAQVTAITLSREQLAFARAAVAAVDFRLQDYRDVAGRFDRIVSIEMIEAVGEAYWSAYFHTLRDRLTARGKAVLQIITISDERFEHYRGKTDFIQRYIFPGGMLPSKAVLAREIARAGLTLAHVETFGASYAKTLAEWRRRFLAAWPDVEKLGFAASFKRIWEYYLCYCEAGFRTGAIDVGLYVLTPA